MWKLPIAQQFSENQPLPIMNYSGIQMIICNFLVKPELRDIKNFSYFHNDPVIKIPKFEKSFTEIRELLRNGISINNLNSVNSNSNLDLQNRIQMNEQVNKK